MKSIAATCPMNQADIIAEYFAESRNHLLEIAAFFDRLERAQDAKVADVDFRVQALKEAAEVLTQSGPQRVKRMALLLSDPTDEPRKALDRKAAWGAWQKSREEC